MKLDNKIFTSDWWTARFALIVRDEENFEEKRRIPYTPLRIALFTFLFFLVVFSFGFWVANQFFSKNTLMGSDVEAGKKLIEMNITLDSLTEILEAKDNYVSNIRKVLGGDVNYLKGDTNIRKVSKDNQPKMRAGDSIDIDFLAEPDLKLRQEMENTQVISKNASLKSNTGNERMKNVFLFSPIKGIVSDKYNSKTAHYGVDIVSEKDAPIKSVSEGTVVMASWTDDTGYVITIQHASELISVYKHCSVLLKKAGDFVKAGEIVAIIGNTGELTSGPHLHFELWYQGNPVNPEGFVAF